MKTREELKAKYPSLHFLEPGTRYIASRPFNQRGRTEYPVQIRAMTGEWFASRPVVTLRLSFAEADALVNAFNNGKSSFDGRVW